MALTFDLTGSIDTTDTHTLYLETENTMKLLCLGSRNKRLLNTTINVGINRYIFENNIDVSITKSEISDQIYTYLNYVKVLGVEIKRNENDKSVNSIVINWSIPEVSMDNIKNTYLDFK